MVLSVSVARRVSGWILAAVGAVCLPLVHRPAAMPAGGPDLLRSPLLAQQAPHTGKDGDQVHGSGFADTQGYASRYGPEPSHVLVRVDV